MKYLKDLKTWEDGISQVVCGDCLELMKKMPDRCVDLVITDPPYGINYMGGATNARKRGGMENDDVPGLYQKIYPEIYRILKNDGTAYIFFATGREKDVFPIPLFYQYEVLIWFKINASFGAANSRYHQDYEPFLYLRKLPGSKWRGGNQTKKGVVKQKE